jgi:uncharacterized protein
LSEHGCATLPEGHDLAFKLDKLGPLFRREYAYAAEWLAGRYKLGKRLHFHHFTYMISRLLYGQPHASECGAGKGYLSVDVDGRIYPCHRHHSPPIGSVEEGGVDQQRAAPWADNRWYTRERCPTCPLHWACGGGCRMDSALLCGDIRKPDPISCWFKRVFVEEAAWIMSEVGPAKLAQLIPK